MSSFKFDDRGLKKLIKNLEKAADSISGPVSLSKLFNPSFMKRYTNFDSFDDLLKAGGFDVETQEDFENIPEGEFDKHIVATTKFRSWEEMKSKVGQLYIEGAFKKL